MTEEFHTSPEGRALIEKWEGLRLHSYQDIVGIWTIGYGHIGPDIGPGVVWTKEQADQALTDRLTNEFEPALNYLIGAAPTTQGQFDAMVCLEYNIGTGETEQMRINHQHGTHGFAGSSVLREHVAGNYQAAADDFYLWNHAGGREVDALTNRRGEEAQLYIDDSPGV